ncbi:MAG: amidase [Nodosilinea sp.]
MVRTLNFYTAGVVSSLFRQGELTSSEFVQSCFTQINKKEPHIQAWNYLDREEALYQAAYCDGLSPLQLSQLPLAGIPIGIKDIFATPTMPTTWGLSFYQHPREWPEAAVVQRLRSAGAILLGKTVTTELATTAPGPTANPHHWSHTPGGSSSGSAAAVADGMVPLALGSQTMGSILRPAAYCGIFGFKPSFGLISRHGMLSLCRDLDHVGMFARSLEDIALLLRVLAGADDRDPDCLGASNPATELGDRRFRLLYLANPYGPPLEPMAAHRLEQVQEVLAAAGIDVDRQSLPPSVATAWDHVQNLCAAGLTANHGAWLRTHWQDCSAALQDWVIRGEGLDGLAYAQARQAAVAYSLTLQTLMADYDAILTPVTPGPAPAGLGHTGTAYFCSLWTLLGWPALSIPVGTSPEGLPLGCQLVGRPRQDVRLLQIAEVCWALLSPVFGDIQTPCFNRQGKGQGT